MQLNISTKNDFTLIIVQSSRIDAINSPELCKKVRELANQGVNRIVIDLAQVGFMDSSGLGAIVSILKMLGATGDLVIAGTHGIVADLFQLTRMDRVFRMCTDVESAKFMMATV